MQPCSHSHAQLGSPACVCSLFKPFSSHSAFLSRSLSTARALQHPKQRPGTRRVKTWGLHTLASTTTSNNKQNILMTQETMKDVCTPSHMHVHLHLLAAAWSHPATLATSAHAMTHPQPIHGPCTQPGIKCCEQPKPAPAPLRATASPPHALRQPLPATSASDPDLENSRTIQKLLGSTLQLLLLLLAKEAKGGLDRVPVDHRLVVLVQQRLELGRLADGLQVLVATDLVVVVKAGGHGGLQRLETLVHAAHHGVAARHVVLRDLVDGGDAREVVAHVVARLHGQDVLKVHQRALQVVGLELGQRVVKQLAALALVLLALHVVALLHLLGAHAVVAARALAAPLLLRCVHVVVVQRRHVAKVALDLHVHGA
mmetsp:Transcript_28912/g.73831  ORF Transcript_28912/g.73831 Transcript_28912/m.73831 type:complete len:371 (-) Transcript_28912:393-1505(-)